MEIGAIEDQKGGQKQNKNAVTACTVRVITLQIHNIIKLSLSLSVLVFLILYNGLRLLALPYLHFRCLNLK